MNAERDKQHRTPLHHASMSGDLARLSHLLSTGSDPHTRDTQGRNAFHYAASSESSQPITTLLNYDSSLLNTIDHTGRSALHYAIFNPHPRQVDIIRTLLESGVSVDSLDNSKKSPLHYASESSKPRAIRILMKWGANTSLKDSSGKSPIEIAANENIKNLILSYNRFSSTSKVPSLPVLKQEPSLKTGNKEKLIGFLRKVQESGIKNNQHVIKPALYSSSWVESLVSPGALHYAIQDLSPSEAVLKVFNVLFPYPNPLPTPKTYEEEIQHFFGTPVRPHHSPLPSHRDREPPQIVYSSDNSDYLDKIINIKDQEIQRLHSAFNEATMNYQKSLALLPTAEQLQSLNKEKEEALAVIEKLQTEISDYRMTIDKQKETIEELRKTVENSIKAEDYENLKQSLIYLETDNRALRFRAGQIFLKGLEHKLDEIPPATNEPHLQDFEIIQRLIQSLKGNPPSFKQRLIDVDANSDKKVTRAEVTKVLAAVPLPPQDIVALLRIVGFSKQTTLVPIDSIASIINTASSNKQKLEEELFQKLKTRFNTSSLTLEQTFQFMDVNKDGSINFQEFSAALDSLGLNLGREDIHSVFAVLDSDHNGHIALDELKLRIEAQEQVARTPSRRNNKKSVTKAAEHMVQSTVFKMEKPLTLKTSKNFTPNPQIEESKTFKQSEIVQKAEEEIASQNEVMPQEIPSKPPQRKKAPLNGSLVIAIISGNNFKPIHLYCSLSLPGAEKSLRTEPYFGPAPQWNFKGRMRLYGTDTTKVSQELAIDVNCSEGFVSGCVLDWLPVLDFPNTWAIRSNLTTRDSEGRNNGVVQVHLMWVPKSSVRVEVGGNLEIRLLELKGLQDSTVQFSVSNALSSIPAKSGNSLTLKDIRLKPNTPIPCLKCTFVSNENREVILWRNLSMEAALIAKDWTDALNVNLGEKYKLVLRLRWTPYSQEFELEEKAATKLQALMKGALVRRKNLLKVFSEQENIPQVKIEAKKIITRENRRYLVCVIDNDVNYIVKAHIADDPNIPMYQVIHEETFEKQPLENIYKNITLKQPVPLKRIDKRVIRDRGRYFLVGIFEEEENYTVKVHIADDPDFPMYEPVLTRQVQKQPVEKIYKDLDFSACLEASALTNLLTGSLIVLIVNGQNLSNLLPRLALGKYSAFSSVLPPYNRYVTLRSVSVQKHMRLKFSLVNAETLEEEGTSYIDWTHALSSKDDWTSEFNIKIHKGILTLKLRWQEEQPVDQQYEQKKLIEEESKSLEKMDDLGEKSSNVIARKALKQNNRFYFVNVVEQENKWEVLLHLADDINVPMYRIQDSKQIPSLSSVDSVLRDLKISNSHKFI